MRSRREALENRLQREQAELLRRHLSVLRTAQRGSTLPPAPSTKDRALFVAATPAERARADVLLQGAGLLRADIARANERLGADGRGGPVADGAVDDLTRRLATTVLRGRR